VLLTNAPDSTSNYVNARRRFVFVKQRPKHRRIRFRSQLVMILYMELRTAPYSSRQVGVGRSKALTSGRTTQSMAFPNPHSHNGEKYNVEKRRSYFQELKEIQKLDLVYLNEFSQGQYLVVSGVDIICIHPGHTVREAVEEHQRRKTHRGRKHQLRLPSRTIHAHSISCNAESMSKIPVARRAKLCCWTTLKRASLPKQNLVKLKKYLEEMIRAGNEVLERIKYRMRAGNRAPVYKIGEPVARHPNPLPRHPYSTAPTPLRNTA